MQPENLFVGAACVWDDERLQEQLQCNLANLKGDLAVTDWVLAPGTGVNASDSYQQTSPLKRSHY